MEQRGVRVIQSVQRAIDIINCFDDTHVELTLGEISNAIHVVPSTTHGILLTLMVNGFIAKTKSGRYRLGPALLSRYSTSQSTSNAILLEICLPWMTKLSESFNSTVDLNRILDGDFLFLHQICPTNSQVIIRNVRGINPSELHRTSTGKWVLLSMNSKSLTTYYNSCAASEMLPSLDALDKLLAQAAHQGYSIEDEDYNPGILSIACPIIKDDAIVAALSITNTTYFIKKNELSLVQSLQLACEAIAASYAEG